MTFQKIAGRYALVREIGRGGAGAVWLAVDEVLGRDVALKRIGLPPGLEDADVTRAEREARLAARVSHPNVVSVFDFVEGRDEFWMVMEYVDGTNLGRMIRTNGPLHPHEAARILAQATLGLAAAHDLGIVHRDVKPSNILLGDDGAVKLSDFGIARGMGDASLTQTGLVTGSPAYLAPEVATGRAATTASDIWSVGATLYHALAGTPPYHHGDEAMTNPLATLYRIAHEDPPRLRTEDWLASVLQATMSHDAAKRPTAVEVSAQLRSPSQSRSPSPDDGDAATRTLPSVPAAPRHAGTPQRRPRRRLLAIGAVVLIVLALAGGSLLATRGGDTSPTTAPGAGASARGEGATAPTEAELEQFARNYVETASSDPPRGFQMLTPEYRAASPEYHEFWSAVRSPRILQVSGDPANLRVSYTYEYRLRGAGKRSEDVVLHLVQQDGELLIDGASSQ